MTKYLWVVLFLSSAVFGYDASLVQGLAGNYPVLERKGDTTVAATLTIIADDQSIGFEVTPLLNATNPVEVVRLVFPAAESEITSLPDGVLVMHSRATEQIEFKKMDGYLQIVSTVCEVTNCAVDSFLASQGKAPGEVFDPRSLAQKFAGDYQIDTAGGSLPHTFTRAKVEARESTLALEMPYCSEELGECDLGMFEFSYEKIRVFRRELGEGHEAYTMIISDSDKQPFQYFAWDEGHDGVIFRNFHYNDEDRFLEHRLTRLP